MKKTLLHYFFPAFLGLSIKFRKIFLGLDSTLFMKYTFGSDAEAFGGWTLKVRVNFRQESYYGKWNVSLMSVCKVDAKAKRWNRDAKNGKNFGSRKPTQKVSIKNCINIQVYFSLKTRANGPGADGRRTLEPYHGTNTSEPPRGSHSVPKNMRGNLQWILCTLRYNS